MVMEIAIAVTRANLYPDPNPTDGAEFYLSGHWIQHASFVLLLLDGDPPICAVFSWDFPS
jgi:hypothetical protein